jgi:hypothetical protein
MRVCEAVQGLVALGSESNVCPTLFALLELGLERGHRAEQRIAACLRRLPQAELFSPPILA